MKNRNIPYYVAALMLAAGVSTSFVSCVDTDESETVTKLRQEAIAKIQADADLQKAYAEVERAKAENEKALAALNNAQAAVQNATAQKTLADAKKQELINAKTEKTNDAVIAKEIAEANQAAQTAIESQAEATQKYKVAAADYERALKAAQKTAEEKAAQLGFNDKGANIVAQYLSSYVEAQKATLEAQVAYNDAVNAAISGYKANNVEVKGTVDFENEVKIKEVALANAQAALAEVEKKFESLDVENWQKEYDAAETSLVKVKQELAKLEETVKVKEAAVTSIKKTIDNTFDTWASSTATYSYDINEGLKEAIFGKYSNEFWVWETRKRYNDLGQEEEYSVPTAQLSYAGGKLYVQAPDRNTPFAFTQDIFNEDAEIVLQSVLNNNSLKSYKEANGKNNKKQAWDDAKDAFNNSDVKANVEGKGKKTSDEESSEDYKGLKADYIAKASTYKNETDEEKKATAKSEYELICNKLFGGLVDPNGNKFAIGSIPSDEEVLEALAKNQQGTPWGTYGIYIRQKYAVSDAEKEYNNYSAGNTLYGQISESIKTVEKARVAAENAKAEAYASNADLVKAKAELEEAELAYDAKDIEKESYEAVKNAISNAATSILGLKDKNGNDVSVDFGKLESEKKNALAALEKEVAKAQAEKDAADAALTAHNNGLSTAKINVDYKKKLWDIAKEKEDAAKAEYEAVKKVYETKAE